VSSLPVGIDQGVVCVLGGDVVRGPDGAVVGVGERPVKEGAVEVLLCRGAERVVVGQIHNLNSTVNLAVRIVYINMNINMDDVRTYTCIEIFFLKL
jgi:hypothetical protein